MVSLLHLVKIVFFSLIVLITIVASFFYTGDILVYLLFSSSSIVLLYCGFRSSALFFDTFISLFLWLGFWLKATLHILIIDGSVYGATLSNDIVNNALFVSSFSFFVLIVSMFIREKYIFKYALEQTSTHISGLFLFYKEHRKLILIIFTLLFISISFSNYFLGIYQRGENTRTILPFGLNGIYKWLLLFGLSSISAMILKYEFLLEKKEVYLVPILTLIEAFMTNVSLLSRGMLINTSALGLGLLKNLHFEKIQIRIRYIFLLITLFGILFFTSVFYVNHLRDSKNSAVIKKDTVEKKVKEVKSMFLRRFVGLEGIIAVSKNDNKGWAFFKEALSEKYDENKMSFYDSNLILSSYRYTDMTKHHYISLPGYIAFFYYADSLLFLFFILMATSFLAFFLEIAAYRLSGNNIIFAALIGEVIAYRFIHFGYVPSQSYLLFGAIVLNICIFYLGDKFFTWFYLRREKRNESS